MISGAPVLGVRADGGPGRGVGHVARCLALAQAWRDLGGDVVLATEAIPDRWRSRYEVEQVVVGRPGGVAADIWVIDGYDLGADVAAGSPHVRIDDRDETGDGSARLVIDQNLGASPVDYPQDADRLLLGPRYALLRRDLVAAAVRPEHRPDGRPPRVLVAQGGAPAESVRGFTAAVVARLPPEIEVIVWSGDDDPVPALRSADVALVAAGSTLWELCLFGVPPIVFTVARNQVPLAAAIVGAGLAEDGGSVPGDAHPERVAVQLTGLLADHVGRLDLADRLRSLVDGRGAIRAARHIWTEVLGRDLFEIAASESGQGL